MTEEWQARGGGALKRGQGAPLERLTHFGDAVHGVGTLDAIPIYVEAAELVAGQTAMQRMVSTGADTKLA